MINTNVSLPFASFDVGGNTQPLRVIIDLNRATWFLVADVLQLLGVSTGALAKLTRAEQAALMVDGPSGPEAALFVDELGALSLAGMAPVRAGLSFISFLTMDEAANWRRSLVHARPSQLVAMHAITASQLLRFQAREERSAFKAADAAIGAARKSSRPVR